MYQSNIDELFDFKNIYNLINTLTNGLLCFENDIQPHLHFSFSFCRLYFSVMQRLLKKVGEKMFGYQKKKQKNKKQKTEKNRRSEA